MIIWPQVEQVWRNCAVTQKCAWMCVSGMGRGGGAVLGSWWSVTIGVPFYTQGRFEIDFDVNGVYKRAMRNRIIFIVCLLVLAPPAYAGWDVYFFGVNGKVFKEANYGAVAIGVVTSVAVHAAGHYAYAWSQGMKIRQDGLYEMAGSGYSDREYRELSQFGFALQHLVGVVLTSIPATRQTDFTRGYVAYSFFNTLFYPVFDRGKGDLSISSNHGGSRDLEYAAFMLVASHNLFRVKWYK